MVEKDQRKLLRLGKGGKDPSTGTAYLNWRWAFSNAAIRNKKEGA